MRRRLALFALAAFAGGCSLGRGINQPQKYYMLQDPGARAAARPAADRRRDERSIVIGVGYANPLADGRALVFSRAPGERLQYQFAHWAERPSQRLAALLEARLDAAHAFASVGTLGSGLTGDLLVNLDLEELYHDAAREPGTVHIAMKADLVDRRGGGLLGRSRFTASEPVATADAAGAVAAFDRAVTRLLDAMVPWVETTAGRERMDAARGPDR